jgi:hypothetical protein
MPQYCLEEAVQSRLSRSLQVAEVVPRFVDQQTEKLGDPRFRLVRQLGIEELASAAVEDTANGSHKAKAKALLEEGYEGAHGRWGGVGFKVCGTEHELFGPVVENMLENSPGVVQL